MPSVTAVVASKLLEFAARVARVLGQTKATRNERMAVSMAKAKDRVSDMKPYVMRAVQDDEVRDNLKSAIASAREVYAELLGGRSTTAVATRVATDKEIQENLRGALDDLRKAANRVQGKKEHSSRNATLLLAGIALGILFNPVTGAQTREWISEKLLGGEESGGSSGTSGNSSSG